MKIVKVKDLHPGDICKLTTWSYPVLFQVENIPYPDMVWFRVMGQNGGVGLPMDDDVELVKTTFTPESQRILREMFPDTTALFPWAEIVNLNWVDSLLREDVLENNPRYVKNALHYAAKQLTDLGKELWEFDFS